MCSSILNRKSTGHAWGNRRTWKWEVWVELQASKAEAAPGPLLLPCASAQTPKVCHPPESVSEQTSHPFQRKQQPSSLGSLGGFLGDHSPLWSKRRPCQIMFRLRNSEIELFPAPYGPTVPMPPPCPAPNPCSVSL